MKKLMSLILALVMVMTLILLGPTSFASAFVKPINAALLAE